MDQIVIPTNIVKKVERLSKELEAIKKEIKKAVKVCLEESRQNFNFAFCWFAASFNQSEENSMSWWCLGGKSRQVPQVYFPDQWWRNNFEKYRCLRYNQEEMSTSCVGTKHPRGCHKLQILLSMHISWFNRCSIPCTPTFDL